MGSGGASSVLFWDRPMQPDQIRAREKGTEMFFRAVVKQFFFLFLNLGLEKI